MRRPQVLTCPYCSIALENHGVREFKEGYLGWPFGLQRLQIYACPSCGKVELFLVERELGDQLGPEAERRDRSNWTCECGEVNASAELYCRNCGDPRSYNVE